MSSESRWDAAIAALTAYAVHHGNTYPSQHERMPDGRRLSAFTANARSDRDRHPPHRRAQLEAVPHWQWRRRNRRTTNYGHGNARLHAVSVALVSWAQKHRRLPTAEQDPVLRRAASEFAGLRQEGKLPVAVAEVLSQTPLWPWPAHFLDWTSRLLDLGDYLDAHGCRPPSKHYLSRWVANSCQDPLLSAEHRAQLQAAITRMMNLPPWYWMNAYQDKKSRLGKDGDWRERQWFRDQAARTNLPPAARRLVDEVRCGGFAATADEKWRTRREAITNDITAGTLTAVDRKWLAGQRLHHAQLPAWKQATLDRTPIPSTAPSTARAVHGLDTSNRTRAVTAAAKTAAAARQVLAGGSCPPKYRRALQLRTDHPEASMRELGAMLGITKNAYAALLRRGLAHAQS